MGAPIAQISVATASEPTSIVTTKSNDSLIPLVDQIREHLADKSREDLIVHAKLLSSIHALQSAVETPLETIYRIGHRSWQNAAIRVALDLGIFSVLVERAPEPVEAKELALRHGADEVLISMLGCEYALVAF